MGESPAILAGVLFALGTVLQQKGTLSTSAGGDEPGMVIRRHGHSILTLSS
jgi:hypothetical protein